MRQPTYRILYLLDALRLSRIHDIVCLLCECHSVRFSASQRIKGCFPRVDDLISTCAANCGLTMFTRTEAICHNMLF